MKKISLFLLVIFLIVSFSSCERYNKRRSERIEYITSGYVYSWGLFESKMVISKNLTEKMYVNPSDTNTLFELYMSLDDIVNFEAEHFSRGEANIDWYDQRDEFVKKIKQFKVDIGTNKHTDGLTDNQYKSLVYRRFYTDLSELEAYVRDALNFEINLIPRHYGCL